MSSCVLFIREITPRMLSRSKTPSVSHKNCSIKMYFRFVCFICCSDRRCNWKIKQKFYAAFGEAFTGFSAFDTVQDQIQPVWHEHTRTQPLNRDPVLAMEWIFVLATPNGLIFGAKTWERDKGLQDNNQTPAQANGTKRKYYRCLHWGKPTHTVILSSEVIGRIRKGSFTSLGVERLSTIARNKR